MDAEDHAVRWMTMTSVEHVATAARLAASNGPIELAQLHAMLAIAKGGTSVPALEAYLIEMRA